MRAVSAYICDMWDPRPNAELGELPKSQLDSTELISIHPSI